jgi:hypothetical protein
MIRVRKRPLVTRDRDRDPDNLAMMSDTIGPGRPGVRVTSPGASEFDESSAGVPGRLAGRVAGSGWDRAKRPREGSSVSAPGACSTLTASE